jgi:putative ABC transport system permease protein
VRGSTFESWWHDIRSSARTLGRSPGFALVAILTLALGIGANTAIFSVVNAVLLKPLPYRDSDRLVRLMMITPSADPMGTPQRGPVRLNAAEIAQLRSRTRTLSHLGTVGSELMGLSGGYEEAGLLEGTRVSSSIFQLVQVPPLHGRLFGSADEAPDADPVILLSYGMWQRHFAGNPDVVGRTVTLNSVLGPRRQTPCTVVGVMPQGFAFPSSQTRFWMPLEPAVPGSGGGREPLVARLADGVSIQEAAGEIGPIVDDLRQPKPGTTYSFVREQDEMSAPVKPALLILMAAVGFVLLIACANVANLLLARATRRRREMAIRAAIGAGRGRLMRQALIDSLMIATIGAMTGVALAIGGIRLLRSVASTMSRVDLRTGPLFPRVDEIGLDVTVLGFTIATALLTGVLFGLAPALRQSRSDPIDALREGTGSSASGFGGVRRAGLRSVLVVVEIGVATMLLVGGGLLIGSYWKLLNVDPGYDPSGVLTFQVTLPLDRYPDDRLRTFAEDLVERVRTIPGVRAAAYANQVPMVKLRNTLGELGRTPASARPAVAMGPDARFVSRDYLDVMGIRVIAGRGFDEHDRAGQQKVLLINQTMARRVFQDENPVGKPVYMWRDPAPWQIIGVVADVRQFALDRAPEPQLFGDLRQWSGNGPLFPIGAYYTVRTEGQPAAAVAALRSIVRELEPQAALFNVAPMEQVVGATVARPRMYAILLGMFAAVGAALAAIGIYGVMAYSVAQRTREVGIRMALGAQRADVISLVLGQSLVLTGLGLAVGLAGAAGLTRYMDAMLFGLTPLDLMTFVAVAALFATVAALAAFVPARRATKVDPLVALRDQ